MAVFKPCKSRILCTEEGTHCRGCGRLLDHINRTRQIVDDLTDLALEGDFVNVEEFLDYVRSKAKKKINYRRESVA